MVVSSVSVLTVVVEVSQLDRILLHPQPPGLCTPLRLMCSSTPQESCAAGAPSAADAIDVAAVVAAGANEENVAVAEPAVDDAAAAARQDEAQVEEDPLARFAVAAAQRQAVERGDDAEDGVDMAFVTRALAESRRMRDAATKDQKKRADQLAQLCARHGEQSAQLMAQAMAEHAAEVLTPQQAALVAAEQAEAMPIS